jgi:hypothetical protein
LSGIGSAFETMCDAVLPKELEFVGDALGLVADLKTGNMVGAFEHATDLVKDLPQQLEQLKKSKTGAGPDDLMTPTWSHEPDPPPLICGSATSQATPANVTPTAPEPQASQSRGGWRGTPPASSSAAPPPAELRGAPVPVTQPPATAPISSAGSTSGAATRSSSTDIFGMSNDELMKAVRTGNLPKDLDPKQMMALQARINEITEMNQMMTAMMRALHDMSMAILQNLRA